MREQTVTGTLRRAVVWRQIRDGFYESGKSLKVQTQFHFVASLDRVTKFFSSSSAVVSSLVAEAVNKNYDPKTNFFLMTVPSGSEAAMTTLKSKGFPVFTVNTGNYNAWTKDMLHVGMDDYEAGYGAGERFATLDRAWLRVHLKDAPRARTSPAPADDAPLSTEENALIEAIVRELRG